MIVTSKMMTRLNRQSSVYIPKAVSSSLNNGNILSMFMGWFVLLLLIFVPLCLGVISSVSINIDSTIIVGILSVPFAGAVAMATAIYSKRKS